MWIGITIIYILIIVLQQVDHNKERNRLTDELQANRAEHIRQMNLWMEERKDLYNRIQSQSLTDYKIHTGQVQKSNKPSNYFRAALDAAERKQELEFTSFNTIDE